MKIVFSRKGFDSSPEGRGGASPIINGEPVSLPIPTGKYPSVTTYGDLDLGERVSEANKDYTAKSLCHEDPMFWDDRCSFGQTGGAQGVLENRRVREGDVFLFFGLFRELGSKDRHHRIFGYLKVEEVRLVGSSPRGDKAGRLLRQHPHTIAKWNSGGKWNANNTIYLGHGRKAKRACDILRLTKSGGPASYWCVPQWLRKAGRTQRAWRRLEDGTLRVVVGQEFVTDVGDLPEPKKWLDKIITAIETGKGSTFAET